MIKLPNRNGATTGSATNVLTYTPQDQVGSESFSTVANDKLVYDYFQPGDVSPNASPGSIRDMKIETSAGSVLAEYDYQYEPSSKRLLNITLKGANSGNDQVFTYGYQANSSLIGSIASGTNNFTTNFVYEPSTGRLHSIAATNPSTGQADYAATYGYYANDQRMSDAISRTNADGSTQNYNTSYTYDTSDQLKTATSTAITGAAPPNQSYNYDGVGNRTDLGLGTVSLVNQYASLTYDSRGNTINDGVNAYTYDPADRLTSVTPNAPTASSLKSLFQYDVQGRRTQKDVFAWAGGAWVFSYTRKWLYDGVNPVAEFDGNDNLLETFAWGQDGNLLAVTDLSNPSAPRVYMAVVDGSGNVTQLIDGASGTVAASFQVDPYGKLLSATGNAANLCPFVWQGHYRDSETGVIFSPVRAQKDGRFLQRDPAGESGGFNLYQSDAGDPINKIDRTGNAAQRIETDYINTLSKDNVLDVTDRHFIVYAIFHAAFYDVWAMGRRALTQGSQDMRVDLRNRVATSTDPVLRNVARVGIGFSYVGEGSGDAALLISEGGIYGGVGSGVGSLAPTRFAPVLGTLGRRLVVGGTLSATTAQALYVGDSLLTPEGRDNLTVGNFIDLGLGATASWHLTGGSSGPLNPFNYRLNTGQIIEDGTVVFGANKFLQFSPKATQTTLITRSVGDLRSAGFKDAHHVIQDAAVRDLVGYDTNAAPGVRLEGPSTAVGTPHYNATLVQRAAAGGTYGAERLVAYRALLAAGYSDAAATQAIQEADQYFSRIGVNGNTITRIPGNRP